MEIHNLTSAQREQRAAKNSMRFCLVASYALLAARCTLFAVSDGYVVKVDSPSVYLDWGQASGVSVGDQFDVYREGSELKHPVTGASLGREQSVLSQGVVEAVQEKFSTGKLIQQKTAVKTGDRTRVKAAAAVVPTPVPSSAVISAAPTTAARPAPVELWRSEPIPREATGLASGDVDGDGKPELVIAYRHQLEVYRWNGQALESIAWLDSKSYRNFLAVDVAGLSGAARAQIFASYFMEGSKRAKTVVFEIVGKTLKEAGRMDGFVRAFDRAGGKRELVWQDLSFARELRVRQPALVAMKDSKWKEGPALALPRALPDQQLFGYGWGDWDHDGVEDFALLQQGERLRVFFKDGKWSSREGYGGTRLDFSWEDEQIGSVSPRLLSRDMPDHTAQLLVPHNISATPIRLARLKIFKESELLGFGWNGLEMGTQWKLPIAGSLSDYGLVDLMTKGTPQLWVAAVGTGHKTILLAYQLP